MLDPILKNLLQINRKRMKYLRRELAPYKYSGTMHLIMLYANRYPGASQEEIVCYHGMDKSSIARDAKKLEDMGHIRRERSMEDRRQYKIYLTDAGKEFMPVILKAHDDFGERLTVGLTSEEREVLGALLERAGEGLRE